MKLIWLFIKQLRPKQWTKNLLVFAALIFTIPNVSLDMFYLALVGFVLFSLVSGGVYILNDWVDLEQDRLHPDKKKPPHGLRGITTGISSDWWGYYTAAFINNQFLYKFQFWTDSFPVLYSEYSLFFLS